MLLNGSFMYDVLHWTPLVITGAQPKAGTAHKMQTARDVWGILMYPIHIMSLHVLQVCSVSLHK